METKRENPITGNEGSPIEFDLAAKWTKNYRDKHPGETISQFFGKKILEQILAQDGCLGLRFYYAEDKPLNAWQRFIVSVSNFILKVIGNVDGNKHLIITGVIGDGSDQINEKSSAAAAPAGATLMGVAASNNFVLGEQSAPCPGSPGCPQNGLTY